MTLMLLTGDEAVALAESAVFRARWLALYADCPWATACQHPDFVQPWYSLYRERFLPVVVLEEADTGELLGLLTLARQEGSRSLTGAGARQAEYHAWLGRPATGDRFIGAAIERLREAFAGLDICLSYLPPGIPLGWTAERSGFGRLCALRGCRRPLMHADPVAMARLRNKKNHRQNFNRLSRMGAVRFDRVDEHVRFARIFGDICDQYDFRQGALHRQMPFQADPLKKPFYLELHRRGLLHVTVLTVDGVLAASHVGLASGGCAVHLGINTHAPAFAAHSPGNLLLAMLGVRLAQDGVPLFDLTPGGDEYKEHFATGYDLVFELTVYGGAAQLVRNELMGAAARLAKAGLRRADLRGTDIRAGIDALRGLGRNGLRALGGLQPRSLHPAAGTGDANQAAQLPEHHS